MPLGDSDAGPRFRIELFGRSGYKQWDAVVYDLDDHGPELPYASITAPSLARALDQAGHYVMVAE